MATPTLESQWLGTLRAGIVAPHPVGENLLVFNVLDGALESPKVNATALAPSGDWIQVQPNGNWKLDVRLLFQTDDDALIFCYYNGVLKADESVFQRINAGESVPGSDMYFRSTPYFQTSAPKYAWMNDISCVGKMRSFGDGVVLYDLFEIL